MKRNRPRSGSVEPEAAELLRAALADVQPLAPANRAALIRPKPSPVPAQRLRDEHGVLRVPLGGDTLSDHTAWELGLESGEELLFRRDGLSQQHVRKLRRGHWKIQDQLDLHGLTAPEARVLTAAFLAHAIRNGLRCVRIIHGKGLSSPNREPVLKKKLAVWLAQRDEVLAYCQAPATEGGGGAVLVLLRATIRTE